MPNSTSLPASDPRPDFTDIVRRLRQALGVTQEQLARQLNVTFGTVNGWENGRHTPMPSLAQQLLRMAETAGVLVEETREVEPEPGSAPMTGWPRSAAERRDFYHRIREFPQDVHTWRRELVAWVSEDAVQFPGIAKDAPIAEVRQQVDDGISHLREVAEILATVHGSPDLGNKPDPVDELVYIILSRKTPDAAYRETFDALKNRFPTWDALLRARRQTVSRLIAGGGLGEKKTESIIGSLRALRERFGECTLEPARAWTDAQLEEFLCSLPEVGRKSAYCVTFSCTHGDLGLSRISGDLALEYGTDFELHAARASP